MPCASTKLFHSVFSYLLFYRQQTARNSKIRKSTASANLLLSIYQEMQAIHRKHRKLHFLQIVFSVLKFVLPKLLLSVTENILLQNYFLVQKHPTNYSTQEYHGPLLTLFYLHFLILFISLPYLDFKILFDY